MSAVSPAAGDERPFLLGVTTLPSGEQRPNLRDNRSAGVGLDTRGIAWVCCDRQLYRSYADISGIRLEWEGGGDDGSSRYDVALCTISFSDGTRLIVSSGPGVFRWLGRIRGVPRADGVAQYREFVAELHRRLGPEARSRIAFHYGGKSYPLGFRLAVHAWLGGATIVVPAALALAVEAPSLLLVSFIGCAIVAWMEFALRRPPRSYPPDAIPRLALPP